MTERSWRFPRPRLPVLGDAARSRLVDVAWASLRGRVDAARLSESGLPELDAPGAVFVTLWLDGDLRGCIGSAIPRRPLVQAVAEQARAAATLDPRFGAVGPGEIERLEVEISVLGPLLRLEAEPDERVARVRVGEDGVYVVVGDRSALLLPQVATRFGMSATMFLEEVCTKAGLRSSAWRDRRVDVHTFRTLGIPAPRPPAERVL